MEEVKTKKVTKHIERVKKEARQRFEERKLCCAQCGTKIRYENKNNGIKFCNHSCSASYTNVRRKRPMVPCKTCKELFQQAKSGEQMYCGSRCFHSDVRSKYIERWKSGLEGGGKTSISNHIRGYMLDKHGNKCSQCGWCEVNTKTGNVPVQIDHIDGNWKNNKEDNLRILCPNCHSLTHNYGSLNIGKGRPDRRPKIIKT